MDGACDIKGLGKKWPVQGTGLGWTCKTCGAAITHIRYDFSRNFYYPYCSDECWAMGMLECQAKTDTPS